MDERDLDAAEPRPDAPGTVLLGSIDKRAYLYLCQTAWRMEIERTNARLHGVQDPADFIFDLDGERYVITYARLKAALRARSEGWEADAQRFAQNADYWRARAERAEADARQVRRYLSECARAVGARVDPSASLEFMGEIPCEVRLAYLRAREHGGTDRG